MTLLEAGCNWNYQKSFLRLMRNKGALAALPLHRKVELARFFCSSQLRVGLLASGFDVLAAFRRAASPRSCGWVPCALLQVAAPAASLQPAACSLQRLTGLAWPHPPNLDPTQSNPIQFDPIHFNRRATASPMC